MPNKQAVCLLNDSFPPVIDGVANAVKNYAQVIRDSDYEPIVITPSHPEEEDGAFSFPVIRYPSMDFRKMTGYMAGIPFSPEVARRLEGTDVALLHSHCPIMSQQDMVRLDVHGAGAGAASDCGCAAGADLPHKI